MKSGMEWNWLNIHMICKSVGCGGGLGFVVLCMAVFRDLGKRLKATFCARVRERFTNVVETRPRFCAGGSAQVP